VEFLLLDEMKCKYKKKSKLSYNPKVAQVCHLTPRRRRACQHFNYKVVLKCRWS